MITFVDYAKRRYILPAITAEEALAALAVIITDTYPPYDHAIRSLADRRDASPELLEYLCWCTSATRKAVARNPSSPPKLLYQIALTCTKKGSICNASLEAVAENPNSPKEALEVLAGYRLADIRDIARGRLLEM